MGLQIPSGMDYEVSVRGAGRGCRAAGEGALTRDRAESGDDDLRRGDQSGSRAFADLDTAECVGVAGGTVSEGQEFAQAAERICGAEDAVLGPTSVGPGLLGCLERERDRRGVEEVH